jgi:antitoxin HicB
MQSVVKLPLVIEPQPEGGYTITCPVLPELITEADSLEEVTKHVADALAAIVEAYLDLGRPLPELLRPLNTNSTLWTELLIPMPVELQPV